MRILRIINETQRWYAKENINVSLAMKQHEYFVHILQKYQVEVIDLPPLKRFPEQVFTRDIGFTIGETVYVSDMSCDIRQGEEQILKAWLQQQQLSFLELNNSEIEGGDVLVDRSKVYVGVSSRTSENSIAKLKTLVPTYEIIPVLFDPKFLHLDCVFSIVSEKEALIFPPAFKQEEYQLLCKEYDCIEVSKEEQFTLGTNVLSIGNKTVISLPVNKQVNMNLRDRGYTVEEVDFSEIIKSGGSFRCCSMPLLRERH